MEKINGGNLLEGMAEVVAKQVEGNALPLLKPIDAAQDQLEVFGSAAAKADADARLVLEELMDARVRMDCDAVYQQNEWLKHDLDSERKRTLVYKEKYEASEERIVELEEKIVELEEENERQKEEHEEKIRGKDEEITKLKAQLEWVKANPTIEQTFVLGNQYNTQEDKRSQVAIKEITVENGGAGVQVNEKKEENSVKDDIGYCEYIEDDKVDQITRYGKTKEERLDYYNRIIYRAAQKDARAFAKFLKAEEGKGLIYFDGMAPSEIYAYFKEIYGFLPYYEPAFRSACHYVKWQPAHKRKV